MRLALLSYEYPPETGLGGIGTYTWTQAHALARAGHDVHVLAGAADPGPLRREEDDGVAVWRLHGGAAPGPLRRLGALAGRLGWWWSRNRLENGERMRRLLRAAAASGPFDLVEVPECGAEGLALDLGRRCLKVVRFHSPARLIMPLYETRRGDRALCARLERRAMRGAAASTACSAFLAGEVRARLGLSAPIDVVPNGIDLTAADAAAPLDLRGRLGLAPDAPVVLFAGRLEPRKGTELLGELVPELLSRRAVAFVALGEDLFGFGAHELAPRCAARAPRGSLHLPGRWALGEVRAAMRQAEVVVLPSLWENAPYSVLEAMAAGAALVATNVGGVPELVREGREALQVAPGDVAACLAAVEQLLDDPVRRRALGAAARSRVEREFSADAMAERTLAVYHRVVATREGRA